MSLVGGLSAQFGMADETTFGTAATVNRFLEFNSDTVKHSIERLESSGLRPARRVLREKQWVSGREGVAGDFDFDVNTNGFGLMFKHCLGESETKQPNAGSFPKVWEETFKVGALDGKSFTAQMAAGDSGGTVRALTWAGCKIVKWELSADENGFVKLKPSIDGVSESVAIALASATYAATAQPLSYVGGSIKIAGTVVPTKKFSLTADTKQKTDRYAMRGTASQQKREQLEDALRDYMVSIETEFEDLTLYERFTKGTMAEITAIFEGPLIEGTFNNKVEVVLKACRFDGETPVVNGPGIIEVSTPIKVLDSGDGNGGVLLKYITTDTTV